MKPRTVLAKHVREGDWLAFYPNSALVIGTRENGAGIWIYTGDHDTDPAAGAAHFYEPNETVQLVTFHPDHCPA